MPLGNPAGHHDIAYLPSSPCTVLLLRVPSPILQLFRPKQLVLERSVEVLRDTIQPSEG